MANKTVIFHDRQANERGTSVALYHYARYNEEILGNRSVIAVPRGADGSSLGLYRSRFPNTEEYDSPEALCRLSQQADLLYMLTYGDLPQMDLNTIGCRTGVHCVFTAHNPHGDVYAAISEWVADTYAITDVPVVHHIVDLPDCGGDLRKELNIPPDAVVFGRYGGFTQFNILAVMRTVAQALLHREDIYFLFMNTAPFFKHPRLMYLPKTIDTAYKSRFINTCDAMIHARIEGETFGLSIGEFSQRKKPIITWFWSPDRFHLHVLGEHGIYYRTPPELFSIFMSFQQGIERPDCYSDRFSPQRVMEQFERVFLS